MYGKLFTSLYQGTLRGCADEILVFTNLIAHADAYGNVDKHYRSIAEETGISVDRVKSAITNLEAPDPESRSPEEEGRRLLPLDEHRAWGWQIVNYAKYRSIRNEDDRREQNRLAQQRWREKHKKDTVSRVSQDKPMQKQKQMQKKKQEERGGEEAPARLRETLSKPFKAFQPAASDFGPPRIDQKTLKANHPTLVAVRNLTGTQPDRATWDGLIDILGIDPDLPRLAVCFKAWVMRGFKKANYGWVTDWYVNGITESNNGKGRQQDARTTPPDEREFKRMLETQQGDGRNG